MESAVNEAFTNLNEDASPEECRSLLNQSTFGYGCFETKELEIAINTRNAAHLYSHFIIKSDREATCQLLSNSS